MGEGSIGASYPQQATLKEGGSAGRRTRTTSWSRPVKRGRESYLRITFLGRSKGKEKMRGGEDENCWRKIDYQVGILWGLRDVPGSWWEENATGGAGGLVAFGGTDFGEKGV